MAATLGPTSNPLAATGHALGQETPRPANVLHPPAMRQPYTPPPQKPFGIDDVALCMGDGGFTAGTNARRKPKEKQESLATVLRRVILDHQLGLSVNIVLFVGLAYFLYPAMRVKLQRFFLLSYPTETAEGTMYSQGGEDWCLVASFIIFFTGLRAFCLDYALLPLAQWCGIAKRKGRVRFAEQTYMLVYYLLYWTWGVILFIEDTPKEARTIDAILVSLWRDYPRLLVSAGMKLYYLSQLAFWIQQIVVIHIEERRKDHYQMFTHHVVTVVLLVGSHLYRQWRAGNAILVCMDLIDFIFPLAKILRYLSLQTACDIAFGVFVISWILSRHIAYNAICWSIYKHVNSATMPYGLYSTKTGAKLSDNGGTNVIDNLLQPMLHPNATTVSFNANIRWWFLGLLLALQCITIFWFTLICGVVMRVLRGQGADDTRSDDEGDDEEAADHPAQPSAPIHAMPEQQIEKPMYIEVESTSADDYQRIYTKRATGSKRKSKGISSGLNLGEHKEILNRIGCLSEEQLAREREKRGASPRPGSAAGRR